MKTTNFLNYLIISIALVVIAACQKTESLGQGQSSQNAYPNYLAQAIFASELGELTSTVSADATNGGDIDLNGTTVSIPPGSFVDENGNPVDGDIDISISNIGGNTDMTLTNTATISNGQMLLSGGVVNIGANNGNGDLQLNNPIDVSIPNTFENNTDPNDPNTSTVSTTPNDMEFFIGVEQADGSINWEPVPSTDMQYNPATDSYEFSTDQVGMINCDAFLQDPMDCGTDNDESCLTDVNWTCPSGFEPVNVQVWIHFDNLSSLLPMSYNDATGDFEVQNVLGEQPVHFIILAEKNDALYTWFEQSGLPNVSYTLPVTEANLISRPITAEEWKEELSQLP